MKPTVLLDVDGVLADFVSAALEELFQVTGHRYAPGIVTTWEVFHSLPDETVHKDRVYRRLKDRGGCSAIPVYAGAKEGVARLREVADIVIVTSPFSGSETWMYEREQWLSRCFSISSDEVIHTKKKSRIHGDVLIDDKPEHVEDWLAYWCGQEHYDALGLLWGTARTLSAPEHLTKVSDWETVRHLVKALKR